MSTPPLERIGIAVLVLLSFVPFTWLTFTNRDLPQFGKYQDDGLLVIGARSMHDGDGYRISSLPGKPFQTKYQPLYPLLLTALWSMNGHFPQNLEWISFLQWTINAAFLLLAFALFRSHGFNPWNCAAMTAYLAINPWLLYWGLLPISDYLFAGLVIATFLVVRRAPRTAAGLLAMGFLGAAAYLTKVAGILIVPAIWLAYRKDWKRALMASAPILAAFLAWSIWAHLHRAQTDNSVLWYYTDYLSFHLKNGGLAALPRILQTNLLAFIMTAGNSLLYSMEDSVPGRFLAVVILAAGVSGIRRLVDRTGSIAYPAFCALLLALLLVWNFSPNVRLASPLMPLLVMGFWEEGAHVARLIGRALDSAKASDRITAHVFQAALLTGIAWAGYTNVQHIFRGLPDLIQSDRAALTRDRATFDWCRRSLPPDAVVMVNNDTLFYLTTGLSAVRAVPNSIAFYQGDETAEMATFTRFADFERELGLTHIVLTANDFGDFGPGLRNSIEQTLLCDPHHQQIYHSGSATVLRIQPGVLGSGTCGEAAVLH